MQLLNVPMNWILSTSINSLLSLIEILYYLISLFWFSHSTFIQLTLRLCTSLVMLSLPGLNHGIQKSPMKVNTTSIKIDSSDLIIILMNSTLVFFEFSFIENIKWAYLAQEDREILIFDIILESVWRFFILDYISSGLICKLLQAILSIRLASVLVQGDWHVAMRLKFLVGGILIGLAIIGIQRLKDIQSFRTLGAEPEKKRKNHFEANYNLKSKKRPPTITKYYSEVLRSSESFRDDSFAFEDSILNHRNNVDRISQAKVLNFLPEGVTVLDIEGQVLFMNQYMINIFEFADKIALRDLSQSLSDFKFCEASVHANLLANSDDSISSLKLEDRRLSHGSLGKPTQTELLERVLKIKSLESFISSCRIDSRIRELVEKYMSTFQARYYKGSTERWYTIEMKIHLESRDENYFVILLRDITDRDNKLITLEKEKTLYRDNLIASFSHELRTPLNSNLAFLEQSMDCLTIPTEVKRDLIKPALDSGKLLLSMVDNILDYSLVILNKLRVDIKPCDIIQTVNRCMGLFETKAVHKKLDLSLVIEGEIPSLVYSDHRRISQVLINLLSNAMQFTTQGEIQVRISELEGHNVRITVKDTGIGMDKMAQERLVKTLSSEILKEKVSEASVGSGLGLYISNKLVQSLNHEERTGIKFRSSYGKGSEFYFEIENREQSKYVVSPKGKVFSELDEKCDLSLKFKEYNNYKKKNTFKGSKMSVKEGSEVTALVVDDEIFNIIVIENYCKSMGIATDKALNGREAVEKLRSSSQSNSNTIKLVFMDINMPVMDGYETTTAIFDMMKKGEIEDVIVIGVTAYVSKDMIEKGIECGMAEVLNKPVTKEGLMEVMRKYNFVN